MKTTTTKWSWEDRIDPVCPECGAMPCGPFSDCRTCAETLSMLNSRNKKLDLSGEFSPLAQRLAESMKDDMYL